MSTFRDHIAAMYDGPEGPFAQNTAAAVLAMPEMEAIRKVLKAVGDMGIGVVDDEFVMTTLYELPESVDAWVLGGDQ